MALTTVQVLSSSLPGVRRVLARRDDGTLVEVVEGMAERAVTMPRGGVFPRVHVEDDALVLGPPLARPFTVLDAGPVVILALTLRVLEDLDVLHAAGSVHGALHAEGWGIEENGTFRVRPVLHVPLSGSTPWTTDVAGVASALRGRLSVEDAEAAGLSRASLWMRGMGLNGERPSYTDARAARQSLAAVLRGADADAALAAWLVAQQVRLPPREPVTGGVPARSGAGTSPATSVREPAGDAERSARAWVEREVARARAEGFVRLREGVERTLVAERANLEAEADQARQAREDAVRARDLAMERARVERAREDEARRVEAAGRLASQRAEAPRGATLQTAAASPAMRVDALPRMATPPARPPSAQVFGGGIELAGVTSATAVTTPAAPVVTSPPPAVQATPLRVDGVALTSAARLTQTPAASPSPALPVAVPAVASPPPVATMPAAPAPAAPAVLVIPAAEPPSMRVDGVTLRASPPPEAPRATASPAIAPPKPAPATPAPATPAPAPKPAPPSSPPPATPKPAAVKPPTVTTSPQPAATPPARPPAAPGAPAWAEAPAIRGDASRAAERGAGKWADPEAEAAVARVREAVRTLDAPEHDDAPWSGGALGVTGSDARLHEKGPGKWAEVDADAASARARARMADFGSAPAREVDLTSDAGSSGGTRWGWIVAAAIVLAAVAAVFAAT